MQFLIFPHMRNSTTSVLVFCDMVGTSSTPKIQAFPAFFVVKGVSWTKAQKMVRGSAKFGCYQFPQPLMRSSKLNAQKRADSKETPTHSWNQIRDFFFPMSQSVLRLGCLLACCSSRLLWKDAGPCSHVLVQLQFSKEQRPSCSQSSLTVTPERQIRRIRLRPIRADLALSRPGSPTYL